MEKIQMELTFTQVCLIHWALEQCAPEDGDEVIYKNALDTLLTSFGTMVDAIKIKNFTKLS